MRESFHRRLRDELLDGNVFENVTDAQSQLDAWRSMYNEVQPHQSLGGLTPQQYKEQWRPIPLATGED